MPRAEILSKQALNTLTQLHAELGGKIEGNRQAGDKLRAQMVQLEAVMVIGLRGAIIRRPRSGDLLNRIMPE